MPGYPLLYRQWSFCRTSSELGWFFSCSELYVGLPRWINGILYNRGPTASAQRFVVEVHLRKLYFFPADDLVPCSLGLDLWAYRRVKYRYFFRHMVALGPLIPIWDGSEDVHQEAMICKSCVLPMNFRVKNKSFE